MSSKDFSLKVQALVQASGVLAYCSFIGILFWKGKDIFGPTPNYFGPVTFLLLFSVSALICALLVFYKPYKLFFADKKEQALHLVLYTTLWLFAYFVVFLVLAAFVG